MTTTDTDALRDKMARALHDLDQENAAAGGVMTDGDNPAVWKWAYEWADAVLPVVAAEVRKAKAEALREAAETILSRRQKVTWKTITDFADEYETGGSDERR